MPRKNPRRSNRSPVALVPQKDVPKNNITTLNIPAQRLESAKIPRQRKPSRPPSLAMTTFLYVLRVGIFGAGLAVLAGTILTTFAPTRFLSTQALTPSDANHGTNAKAASVPIKPAAIAKLVSNLTTGSTPAPKTPSTSIHATEEILALKQKLIALDKKEDKIHPQLYFIDLDNGKYVNLEGDTPIAAASTIKIPIAVAFLQDVDAGKIKLNEKLPITKDVLASGAGDIQYNQAQKELSALTTLTKMMVISDNTATNMIIKRLGGKTVVDQRFQEWGLTQTRLQNYLPDLEGTNTTTPHELATVLLKLNQGELVSLKSRDRLLGIMQQTKTRTLLPPGLEPDAIISHKTGDIGKVLGDAGIIDMPSGKRYITVIMAKRPYNDVNARLLIQSLSRTTYQHLKGTEAVPAKTVPNTATTKSTVKPADTPKAAPPTSSILKEKKPQ
ncbi:MAG: serine hydrolase [Snowella sp.]|nr:serine hydrolase [Snowella sp.]